MKTKKTYILLLLLLAVSLGSSARTLRVLAIGNSFSEDAVEQYLYELAAAQGDSLVIGNAYIGGCPIERHWDNAQTGKCDYRYRKIVGGHTTTRNKVDLATIIRDDEWDVISLQQASHFSGLPYTYAHLQELKDYVVATCTNKQVEIIWHMTWAYSKDSKHHAFRFYKRDQQKMYDSILSTVAQEVPRVGIRRIVPSGVTIQLLRGEMGDVLCRDGFHLEKNYGRYAAACTWCEVLTGRKVTGNKYHPASVKPETAALVQKMAHKAVKQSKKKK